MSSSLGRLPFMFDTVAANQNKKKSSRGALSGYSRKVREEKVAVEKKKKGGGMRNAY